MHFCPNCSYIFDIGKSSNESLNESDSENNNNKIILNKVPDLIKLIESNNSIDYSKYKANFTLDELKKNKKYKNFKDEFKILINIIFDDNNTFNTEFKCNNCNFIKKITETTLLYQITNDDIVTNYTLDELKLISLNPILPHKNDYICKNVNCKTHQDSNIKDLVFFKEKKSFKVINVCTICFYNW